MKKTWMVLTAALMTLIICAVALANQAAMELYDKTTDLLFNTSNVTLKAHAELSLNGDWFKTVDGEWQVDGSRSFRQLLLTSPKRDGSERKNGYTIVTDKTDLYLMEVFTPGVYRKGYTGDRKALLRSTVESKHLISLGSALSSQADLFFGKDTIAKSEDGEYRISLDENVPELMNAALNQLARFAAKRYFEIDYDRVLTDRGMSLFNYGTVTEGILYTMQGISMRKADITLKADENGVLSLAEGVVGLNLQTARDGIIPLDITFRVEVSDLGSTSVKPFNPKDYDVVLAPDLAVVLNFGFEEELPAESAPADDDAV